MLLNRNKVENSGTSKYWKLCLRETLEDAHQSQLFTSIENHKRLGNDNSDGQDGNDYGNHKYGRKNVKHHQKSKSNFIKIQRVDKGTRVIWKSSRVISVN